MLLGNRKECLIHGPYRYNVFGLHVASDLLLPEFVSTLDVSVDPDVIIRLGKMPSCISGAIETEDNYQGEGNEFLLRFQGVGAYYVINGNCIIVEPDEHSEEQFVRLFLLNMALSSLLLQRGAISMHGSAVVFDGYCVIFTGDAGVGKSTLAAAFRERGYSLLADDVTAIITDNDGGAWVQPGLPHQKLRPDSAEAMGMDITGYAPVFSRSYGDKFLVPVNTGFCLSPAPLGAIYELTVGESRDVTISRLSASDKLIVLMNNTWCRLVDRLGLKTDHFRICINMAGRVTVSRLTRPGGVFSLEDQIRLLQDDLRKLSPPGCTDRREENLA